jgi:hypothetical protein
MKREALEHPKTLDFADGIAELFPDLAPVKRPLARGFLETLWNGFTAKYAPHGLIGIYSARRIAEAIDWPGDPDDLIDLLVRCRLLDETPAGVFVHGWARHCDKHTHRRNLREHQCFADGTKPRVSEGDARERSGWEQAEAEGRITGALFGDAGEDPGGTPVRGPRFGEADGVEPVPVPVPVPVPGPVPGPGPGPETELSAFADTCSTRAHAAAEKLARLVRAAYPATRVTERQVSAWALEISKIDVEPEVIDETISWLYGPDNDGEYRLDVRSGGALRQKFGRVQAAIDRGGWG